MSREKVSVSDRASGSTRDVLDRPMANPAPATFLFPNPWNLCAKSCRQGPLCDIHHIKGEKSNLWGPWHEENRESALFLPLFCCPGAMDARAGLWAQGCRSVPQAPAGSCLAWHCPLALCGWWNRSELCHTSVLWVCGADAAWHWLVEFGLSPK